MPDFQEPVSIFLRNTFEQTLLALDKLTRHFNLRAYREASEQKVSSVFHLFCLFPIAEPIFILSLSHDRFSESMGD